MPIRQGLATVLTAALLIGAGATVTNAAQPKSYKDCKALNRVYPHGVGRKGARDKTSTGDPVTNFRVNNTVYAYNDGKGRRHKNERDLDRDDDGIACEKL